MGSKSKKKESNSQNNPTTPSIFNSRTSNEAEGSKSRRPPQNKITKERRSTQHCQCLSTGWISWPVQPSPREAAGLAFALRRFCRRFSGCFLLFGVAIHLYGKQSFEARSQSDPCLLFCGGACSLVIRSMLVLAVIQVAQCRESLLERIVRPASESSWLLEHCENALDLSMMDQETQSGLHHPL